MIKPKSQGRRPSGGKASGNLGKRPSEPGLFWKNTSSVKTLEDLMAAEKKRLGLDPARLVFVGIHNLAQYWWCAQQSVFKSRANELQFFDAYLSDRIEYSRRVGLITDLPSRKSDWLPIGDGLTVDHIESMLRERQKSVRKDGCGGIASIQEAGKVYLNPEASEMDRAIAAEEASSSGAIIVDSNQNPLIAGTLQESAYAERYARLRWHWRWDRFVVVGVPDGITREFVYEFKSVGSVNWMRFARPVATAQADLYGYFWKRPAKRVQLRDRASGETVTIEELVNVQRALDTLAKFEAVDAGEPPVKPVAWKCNNCDFREKCPLRKGPLAHK